MANFYKILLLSVLVHLSFLKPLTSKEIYVSTTGSSDANPGTSDQPYASINKAAQTALAGDIIIVRAGTYFPSAPIVPSNSGTQTSPIIIRGEGEVIVDGQLNSAFSSTGIFAMSRGTEVAPGTEWIIIDNFKVRNSTRAGIFVRYSRRITVKNCSTFNTYASGIVCANSSFCYVLNNTVSRACVNPAQGVNTSECITMASVNTFEVAYNTVSDRLVDLNNGGEGIDCKNACINGKVHHNTVFDLVRVGLYIDAYEKILDNIDMYANRVYRCGAGINVASEEGGVVNNIYLHDNVVYDCTNGTGIRLAGYLNNGPVNNVYVYNNTVYNCGKTSGNWEKCGMLVEADNPANSNFVITNNIFANNPGTQVRTKSQSYLILTNNLIFGNSETIGTDAIRTDPLFVNPGAKDFRIGAGSPAIDRAVGSYVSTADYNNTVRPLDGDKNGTAIADLGAFEFIPDGNLPISLISFTGKPDVNNVELNWSTDSEKNNSHFLISHSIDGKTFELLATIPASANGTKRNDYTYLHTSPQSGINYYRLDQVDFDLRTSQVGIRSVEFNLNIKNTLKVYPNPATDRLTLNFEKDTYNMAFLHDLQGKTLINVKISKHETSLVLSLAHLPAGVYTLHLKGRVTSTQQIVRN